MKKRLHFTPFITGLYATALGIGMAVLGFEESAEAIGLIRLAAGLGMACFGLYGIWDGVRDIKGTHKETEGFSFTQLILTDTEGNRSSHVTPERVREQILSLVKNTENTVFRIEIQPPLSVYETGKLTQISCIYHDTMILVAFFEKEDGERFTCCKNTDPDAAAGWFREFLSGRLNFAGWENFQQKK